MLIFREDASSDVVLGMGLGSSSLRLVVAGLIAVSVGVIRSVVEGRRWNLLETLLGAVLAGVIFGQARIVEGIAAAAIFIFGIVAGGRWATRQVPDDETRKRLANPEARSPGV